MKSNGEVKNVGQNMKVIFFHSLVSLFDLVDARMVMIVCCLWQGLRILNPLRVVAIHNKISTSHHGNLSSS